MPDISKLDKNFSVSAAVEAEKTDYYDAAGEPFKIYGLPYGLNSRLPENILISEPLRGVSAHTAGGRIRFTTNSEYIAVRLYVPDSYIMPHMPASGSLGCDMYIKEHKGYAYAGTFMPPNVSKPGSYETVIHLGSRKMRDITINLPLYNSVSNIIIGLEKGAKLKKSPEYTHQLPIVFYGSSITQGGCASKPGNSYEAMISRRFDCDYINLGFSGNAKGEQEVAEVVAKLKMSAFVLDYDHNAPTPEHLKRTHRPFFDTVRKENPELPIIIATRPKVQLSAEEKDRRKTAHATYMAARRSGDKNVYFADGTKMFSRVGGDELCTVDGSHPNDLGFYGMSLVFGSILKKIGF